MCMCGPCCNPSSGGGIGGAAPALKDYGATGGGGGDGAGAPADGGRHRAALVVSAAVSFLREMTRIRVFLFMAGLKITTATNLSSSIPRYHYTGLLLWSFAYHPSVVYKR